MSKPAITHDPTSTLRYDKVANALRDASGSIILDLTTLARELTPAQRAVAAAFGCSTDAMPDILHVAGPQVSDEAPPSQAELDIAAAFVVEPEGGA